MAPKLLFGAVGASKWVENTSQFNRNFIRTKIAKVEKLVANSHDKNKNVTQIANLKQTGINI